MFNISICNAIKLVRISIRERVCNNLYTRVKYFLEA